MGIARLDGSGVGVTTVRGNEMVLGELAERAITEGSIQRVKNRIKIRRTTNVTDADDTGPAA